MLKYFFEIGSNSALFNDLEISKEKDLCMKYMGKFLVISITLKGASSRTFEEAMGMLRNIIGNEAMRCTKGRFYRACDSKQRNIMDI